MESTQTVGIARLVLYRRERAVMLVPRDQGITLWTLRYGDEVRDPDDYFDAIKPEKPEAKLLSLALSMIKERTRSEERRVGQESVIPCRSRWTPQQQTKNYVDSWYQRLAQNDRNTSERAEITG